MESRSIPELLAPAGSLEALKAAVNVGADAVYLSGKDFGARQYAPNFDEDQMVQALKYAHLRNVKVYVTVNTLLYDYELSDLADYLLWLYKAGADALILQDVGVASLSRELIPNMEMHASTQMTINSADGVKWASEFGFKRVVLARELFISELEEIAQQVGLKIELEIFAHGALCYSYSGQCLLSSEIGGRSGNRGRCAQPCRKPYQLLRGDKDDYGRLTNTSPLPLEDDYLLSTRDLALYPELGKIKQLDINSLKIEGRMRSPEYVALVVSTYRKALDKIRKDRWKPEETEISRLKLAFNRGFTSGHLLEVRKKSVMGCEAPGNRGLYIGQVSGKEGRKFLIQLDKKLPDYLLDKGDGILFVSNDREKYGTSLDSRPDYKDTHKIIINPDENLKKGMMVYLTRDISLLREAKGLIQEDKIGQHIPLSMTMELDIKNTPILKGEFPGKDGKILSTEYTADFKMETALQNPITKQNIIKQLRKAGGTPFKVDEVKLDYPGDLFTPISRLNKLRREFLNISQEELIKSFNPSEDLIKQAQQRLEEIQPQLKPSTGITREKAEKNIPNLSLYTSSLDGVSGALKAGCKRIYLEPYLWEDVYLENPCAVHNLQEYLQNIESILRDALDICSTKAQLIWKWPSITNNTYLKYLPVLASRLESEGLSEIMVGSMGAFQALKNLHNSLKISGSESLNITNHLSVDYFSKRFSRLTLSSELSKKELTLILSRKYKMEVPFDLVVQGNLESMVSENCLLNQSGSLPKQADRLIGRENRLSMDKKFHWGLQDAKNRVFPLLIDEEGRSHILNSVEQCLIDHIPELYHIGLDGLIIDARNRTYQYATKMVNYYQEGLQFREKSQVNLVKLNKIKIKIKKISQGGITTGNFLDRNQNS
jgi:putative protease